MKGKKQMRPGWLSQWFFKDGRVIGEISYDARFGANKIIITGKVTRTNSRTFSVFTQNGSQYMLGQTYKNNDFIAEWNKIILYVRGYHAGTITW